MAVDLPQIDEMNALYKLVTACLGSALRDYIRDCHFA